MTWRRHLQLVFSVWLVCFACAVSHDMPSSATYTSLYHGIPWTPGVVVEMRHHHGPDVVVVLLRSGVRMERPRSVPSMVVARSIVGVLRADALDWPQGWSVACFTSGINSLPCRLISHTRLLREPPWTVLAPSPNPSLERDLCSALYFELWSLWGQIGLPTARPCRPTVSRILQCFVVAFHGFCMLPWFRTPPTRQHLLLGLTMRNFHTPHC